MHIPQSLYPTVLNTLRQIMETDYPDATKVNGIWCSLLSYQTAVLGHLIQSRIGNKVFAGPFHGMDLTKEALSGRHLPCLLGTYEWELHDTIEQIVSRPYKNIINIGCAFGYYSVGLARRMPNTMIYAYDISENERNNCKDMAKLNGVADRIKIGERFEGEDFSKFEGDTLVFMDIEGAEDELLDPQKYPGLLKMDIIVEMHDFLKSGMSSLLPARFASTHDIKIMPNVPFNFPIDKILGAQYGMDHFDNLLVTWESREGPTPFGIIMKK